ncbi:hypothetical protein [Antrihabitans cavernicola]|uniref:Prenyltransferase n=1 Tax=Antrihabitans cavernicola TaxID=2495913 RepID=A0A5A7SAM9_9NOCA|nr:hypothetical protein [Spelaeibacter cavernicola]KAA0022242.1 hypothetical protein FOY51_14750 [Spelaeibacter cavernicola]
MPIDLRAATDFMTTHARMIDRRRFDHVLGRGDVDATLAAVDAYRNSDGGYGWGLEPDLRAKESQPGGALHAFEVFAEIAPALTPRAAQLCDWLESVTLPDGGLPFALPIAEPAGCAPFWAQADPTTSSLQITSVIAANAHRVAAVDPAVADHPWLQRATEYSLQACRSVDEHTHAIELAFAVQFVSVVHDTYPEAPEILAHLGSFVPGDGIKQVAGGAADEVMRALDFAPMPGPGRKLFAPAVIDTELRRLADQQQDDGGWEVDFGSFSPAAALEWRGYATVRAVRSLQ